MHHASVQLDDEVSRRVALRVLPRLRDRWDSFAVTDADGSDGPSEAESASILKELTDLMANNDAHADIYAVLHQHLRKREETNQDKFARLLPYPNAAWCLHRILAGLDTFDLPDCDIQALRGAFGWTLSFSRAMHGGQDSMRQWFEERGVDTELLQDKYQCVEQDAEARQLMDARATECPLEPGITCVYSLYDKPGHEPVEYVSSLVAQVPDFRTAGPLKDWMLSSNFESDVGHTILVPVAEPQLYEHSPRVVDKMEVLRFPLFFTPPRIDLAIRMAGCMEDGVSGMQLIGINADGTSTFLVALASILPCGHPCDVLHVPESRNLGENLSSGEVFRYFSQSSGPLVHSRTTVQSIVLNATSDEQAALPDGQKPAAASSALSQGHRAGGAGGLRREKAPAMQALLHAMHIGQWTDIYSMTETQRRRMLQVAIEHFLSGSHEAGHSRVLIMDEMNEIVKQATPGATHAADEQEPSIVGLWRTFLGWKAGTMGQCFRILAYSSDDPHSSEYDMQDQPPLYESRPPRYDHLASVMHTCSGIVPTSMRSTDKACGDDGVTLLQYMDAARVLCGSVRWTLKYAESRMEGAHHPAALAAEYEGYVGLLVRRLLQNQDWCRLKKCDFLDLPYEEYGQGHSKHIDDVLKRTATMAVRADPSDANSAVHLVGSTTMQGVKRFIGSASFPGEIAVEDAPLRRAEAFLESGDALEAEVEGRLLLSALSRRVRLLSDVWVEHNAAAGRALEFCATAEGREQACTPTARSQAHATTKASPNGSTVHVDHHQQHNELLWLPQIALQRRDAQDGMTRAVLAGLGGKQKYIDGDVADAIEQCAYNDRVLIRSVPESVGADFVLYRRQHRKRQVVFVKCTASHPSGHAAPNSPQRTHPPPCADDVMALTGVHRHVFAKRDPRCEARTQEWFHTDSDSEAAKVKEDTSWEYLGKYTPANMWLHVLGCPDELKASLVGEGEHATLTVRQVEGMTSLAAEADADEGGRQSDSEEDGYYDSDTDGIAQDPVDVWDVSMVFIGCTPESSAMHAASQQLECDFAYLVTPEDMDDAVGAWTKGKLRNVGRLSLN